MKLPQLEISAFSGDKNAPASQTALPLVQHFTPDSSSDQVQSSKFCSGQIGLSVIRKMVSLIASSKSLVYTAFIPQVLSSFC